MYWLQTVCRTDCVYVQSSVQCRPCAEQCSVQCRRWCQVQFSAVQSMVQCNAVDVAVQCITLNLTAPLAHCTCSGSRGPWPHATGQCRWVWGSGGLAVLPELGSSYWAGAGSPPSAVPAMAVLSAAVHSAPQLLAPGRGWCTDK